MAYTEHCHIVIRLWNKLNSRSAFCMNHCKVALLIKDWSLIIRVTTRHMTLKYLSKHLNKTRHTCHVHWHVVTSKPGTQISCTLEYWHVTSKQVTCHRQCRIWCEWHNLAWWRQQVTRNTTQQISGDTTTWWEMCHVSHHCRHHRQTLVWVDLEQLLYKPRPICLSVCLSMCLCASWIVCLVIWLTNKHVCHINPTAATQRTF